MRDREVERHPGSSRMTSSLRPPWAGAYTFIILYFTLMKVYLLQEEHVPLHGGERGEQCRPLNWVPKAPCIQNRRLLPVHFFSQPSLSPSPGTAESPQLFGISESTVVGRATEETGGQDIKMGIWGQSHWSCNLPRALRYRLPRSDGRKMGCNLPELWISPRTRIHPWSSFSR
ncbi:hypothetical protein AAFF_G00088870 [Aldrovandia affinis]|uniref:Uncharacterized protein n=1 Tax=Aldrovandia affinis TaxID=143900 RepID=A0AAD7R1G4_9TELE|nr:hypothetical protein AAFF_G00088870 [Aldrovandia affinis]